MGFLQNSLYTASSPSWKPIPWAPWTYCNWSTRNSKVTKQWLTTTSSTDTSFHCPIMCSRSGTSKRFLKRWQLLANPGPWARGKWSRPPDRNLQELKVNDSRILKPFKYHKAFRRSVSAVTVKLLTGESWGEKGCQAVLKQDDCAKNGTKHTRVREQTHSHPVSTE